MLAGRGARGIGVDRVDPPRADAGGQNMPVQRIVCFDFKAVAGIAIGLYPILESGIAEHVWTSGNRSSTAKRGEHKAVVVVDRVGSRSEL